MMNVPQIVHRSWHEPLAHLWSDTRLGEIQRCLAYLKFSPEARNIFRAFSLPMGEVRVVMMALSPYSQIGYDGTRYATGLAMGTPDVDTETLKSIRGCLWNDYHDLRSEDLNLSLEHWHEQGVMLLNKALTVTLDTRDAKEHIRQKDYGRFVFPGWEWFTSEVVQAIDRLCSGVVFVFLGSEAGGYAELVTNNQVIRTPHPVARYYYMRNKTGEVPAYLDFTKTGLFKKIDEITYNIDKTKIQWY